MLITNPNKTNTPCGKCGEPTQSMYGYCRLCKRYMPKFILQHTEMDDRVPLPDDNFFREPVTEEDDYSENSKP